MATAPTPDHGAELRAAIADLMTVGEVAALAGVAERTVWRWVSRGQLPAVRIAARLVRFRRADVERFLADL